MYKIAFALLAAVALIVGCAPPAKACDNCGKLPVNIAPLPGTLTPVPLPDGQTGQITTQSFNQSASTFNSFAPQAVTTTAMVPRTVYQTNMVPVTSMQAVTTAQTVMEPVQTTTLVTPMAGVTTGYFNTLGFNSLTSFSALDVGCPGGACRTGLLGRIGTRRQSQTTTVRNTTTVTNRRGRR